jgi:hypothetical protein
MRTVGLILRWIGAMFTTALIFLIVVAIGALVWQRFGADAANTVDSQSLLAAFLYSLLATFLAVSVGTYVVVPEQRKTAALVLSILICADPLWFVLQDVLASHFSFANFACFCSVALGASIALGLVRSGLVSGMRINPTADVILRWVGAMFTAALIFLIVFTVGALIWRRFGTNIVTTVHWQNFFAAFLAVTVGTLVVRREQRGTAALVLSIFIWAGPLWFVVHDVLVRHYSSLDLEALSGAIIGTLTPLLMARRGLFSGRLVNRVAAQRE